MDGIAFENATKRVMTLLPLVAGVSGAIGAALYYILRHAQVITLQHYGLDSALVSTPFAEFIADGLSTIFITFLIILASNRLLSWPIEAGLALLTKVPAVRLHRESFQQELRDRSVKAFTITASLLSLAIAVVLVFMPLALARWQISRINWFVDANLCQHYCFTYRLSGKEPPVNGLPIAVGSSRIVVIAANNRAHLLDAQSLRGTLPFKGVGQKYLPQAPLRMKAMWLMLDITNGNIRGLWDHSSS